MASGVNSLSFLWGGGSLPDPEYPRDRGAGFQNDADRGPVQVESVCSETEDGSRIAIVGPAGSCRAHQKSADRRPVPLIAPSGWGIIPVWRWFCRRVWAGLLR